MRRTLFTFFTVLFILSCSDSDITNPTEPTEPTPEIMKIKIIADQPAANIFELASFRLTHENGSDVWLTDVIDVYDSIALEIPDWNIKTFIMSQGSNSAQLTHQWSHNFYLPEQIEMLINCYKDDKIVWSNSAKIRIDNNKDFLGYNWKDITESADHSTGYHDVFERDYSFATYPAFKNEVPSVRLFCRNVKYKKDDEYLAFLEESKNILENLITSLYSEPKYDSTDDDLLLSRYNELFRTKYNDLIPLAIWTTRVSSIALVKIKDKFDGNYEYEVHAEPIQ